MNDPTGIAAVTIDGHQYVHVTAAGSNAVDEFAVDPTSGQLSFKGTVSFLLSDFQAVVAADVPNQGEFLYTDGQFVFVTASVDKSLTVFEQGAGGLQFDQLLRGVDGLDEPSGLAISAVGPTDYTVDVASQAGFGLNTGGLVQFDVQPPSQQKPISLAIQYDSVSSGGSPGGRFAGLTLSTGSAGGP